MKQDILFKTAMLTRVFEGFSPLEYYDSEGILSIGYGRNLEVFPYGFFENECLTRDFNEEPMDREEAYWFLNERLSDTYANLSILFPRFLTYRIEIQVIMMDMAYNLGIHGLLKFRNMITAIGDRDYYQASLEMLDSKWARQTKRRAMYHSITMESLSI